MHIYSHHKCGTRWAIDYLRRLADLNGLILETADVGRHEPTRGSDIAFFGNASYQTLSRGPAPLVHIIRNPLSVIVSAYFSHLHSHPTEGWTKLARQRAVLASASKAEGMYLTLSFLEQADFFPDTAGPLYALRTWNWDDPSITTIRMEDLVAAPARTFSAVPEFARLQLPPDQDFRFEAFSGGRRVGEAVAEAHYRSGSSEDWRTELPSALVDYCRWAYADVLERYYPEVAA